MLRIVTQKIISGVQSNAYGRLLRKPQRTMATAGEVWSRLEHVVNNQRDCTIVVIDDDPTGCQTVRNINVLLDFTVSSLKKQLELKESGFYILANTRAFPEPQAVRIIHDIMTNLKIAAKATNFDESKFRFISRGDSTLRGHYPSETNAIMNANNNSIPYHGLILCPAFFGGGRVTIGDVHYVREKNKLNPVAETPFAKDPHFGFQSSNLKDWVLEKTKGDILSSQIISFSLEELRSQSEEFIANKLQTAPKNAVIIVNAEQEDDLNRFMLGLIRAENSGYSYLIRSGASFVASRLAMTPQLLPKSQLQSSNNTNTGGLVVVGSYVPKTTNQLMHLLKNLEVRAVEVDANQLISFLRDDHMITIPNTQNHSQEESDERDRYRYFLQSHPAAEEYLNDIVQQLVEIIQTNKETAVLHTSRAFVPNATINETGFVSFCLTEIIHRLHTIKSVTPSFLVAKGGITSHEVAQYGLGITTALVLGQIAAGVPVWQYCDSKGVECKYVVFPGNVGDDKTLTQVVLDLGVKRKAISTSTLFKPQRDNLIPDAKSLLNVLQTAYTQQRAIAAFNVYSLEGAKAVMQAAQRLHAPAMLQVHPASLHYGGRPLLEMLRAIKENASVPLFIHLDHCDSEEDLDLALSMGCLSSVMIDGSAMPFEDNMRWTKRLAAKAREHGVLVEAELGKLSGEEDGLSTPEKEAKMTDPDLAAQFVRETEVDLLAVTIGNVHGKYSLPPALDFDRLQLIREKVAQSNDGYVPLLVLHGASGLPPGIIQRAIQEGIVKFNVNTDMRNAALDYYQAEFNDGKKKRKDMLPLMKGATEVMSSVAYEKIDLLNNNNLLLD